MKLPWRVQSLSFKFLPAVFSESTDRDGQSRNSDLGRTHERSLTDQQTTFGQLRVASTWILSVSADLLALVDVTFLCSRGIVAVILCCDITVRMNNKGPG